MMKFQIFLVFVLTRPPQVPILLKNFLNEFTEFFVKLLFCISIEKLTGSHIEVMEYFASSLYLGLKTFTTFTTIYFKTSFRGVSFHSLLVTRWNSLVARCKICSLLVAEVTPCKKSIVTRCRSCSLQKNTHCSLQNSLVTCSRSCL